jgi:hypothetical protein
MRLNRLDTCGVPVDSMLCELSKEVEKVENLRSIHPIYVSEIRGVTLSFYRCVSIYDVVFAYEYVKVDSDYKVKCIYFTIENIIKTRQLLRTFITNHTE